jgi:hypothetical protein
MELSTWRAIESINMPRLPALSAASRRHVNSKNQKIKPAPEERHVNRLKGRHNRLTPDSSIPIPSGRNIVDGCSIRWLKTTGLTAKPHPEFIFVGQNPIKEFRWFWLVLDTLLLHLAGISPGNELPGYFRSSLRDSIDGVRLISSLDGMSIISESPEEDFSRFISVRSFSEKMQGVNIKLFRLHLHFAHFHCHRFTFS